MRHRKRRRHIGRHRAPLAPRTRYAMVVTTAVVGAGVVALGAGSSLPQQQAPDPGSSLDALSAAGTPGATSSSVATDDLRRAARANTASRSKNRSAAPAPKVMPDWVVPVVGYELTSTFGWRNWDSSFHQGIDLAAPSGTQVRAASAGVVIKAGWDGGAGNAVYIQHAGGIETSYFHNSEILVKVGQRVEAGEVVALMGSTGYSSGPHCHFQVFVNGEKIDPRPFMSDRGVEIN